MFLADITDRKGDAPLPKQHCLKYPCTTPTVEIFAGVPQPTRFNQLIRAYPARENFGTQESLRFVDAQPAKNCRTSKFHTPQFAIRGRDTQQTTLNALKLSPNDKFGVCTVSNLDKLTYETTQTSFPNHLNKCKKLFSPQYATRNHLSEAPPTRAQQGTSTIE